MTTVAASTSEKSMINRQLGPIIALNPFSVKTLNDALSVPAVPPRAKGPFSNSSRLLKTGTCASGCAMVTDCNSPHFLFPTILTAAFIAFIAISILVSTLSSVLISSNHALDSAKFSFSIRLNFILDCSFPISSSKVYFRKRNIQYCIKAASVEMLSAFPFHSVMLLAKSFRFILFKISAASAFQRKRYFEWKSI